MQIFEINRQIYQEASAIFYSQNMFHFDRAVLTLPFLRDRGTRSLENLRKISILYPSPAPDGLYSEAEPWVWEGDDRMWQDICCFLSLRVRRLAHLDLQVERMDDSGHESYNDSDWQSLQTPSDFPYKRRIELATLSIETKVTVSEGLANGFTNGKQVACESHESPLFTPLRPWLEDSIARLRGRSGLDVTFPESKRIEAAKAFWTLRRKCRKERIWHLINNRVKSEKDDEASNADDDIAETAFRRECST